MRLKRREIERHLAAGQELLAWLGPQVAQIVERANADSYEGIQSSQGGRNSGHSDPTAQALPIHPKTGQLTHRYDPAGDLARDFRDELARFATSARKLEAQARSLLAIPHVEASELATKGDLEHGSFGKWCANPYHKDGWVSGQGADRIKSGRCPACYEWRRRHNGEERPAAQCELEEAS